MTELTKVTLTGNSESLYDGFTKVNLLFDNALLGDGTANRNIRVMRITIDDAAQASKIKPSAASIFNSDTLAAEDNLAASGDTGNFNLSANGNALHIEAAAITGNATHILMCTIPRNAGGEIMHVDGSVVSNGITLTFRKNDDSALDLTAHVDTGKLYVDVIYLTDA